MSTQDPRFRAFVRAVTSTHPDTICALANDAAERHEPQTQANLYKPGTLCHTFFLVCYLNRREELKFEAQAAGAIAKAKTGGGMA